MTDDPTGFWEKLSRFLKRHFTERDAAKVLKEFKRVCFLLVFTVIIIIIIIIINNNNNDNFI